MSGWLASWLLLAVFIGTSEAAITYVGFQANVESKNNDPTSGWRNSSPSKPFDIDGDNILGTDGYHTFGNAGTTVISMPTYIGAVTRLSSSANGSTGWGLIDNPSDPSGADTLGTGMWFNTDASENIAQIVITGSDLTGQILRIGVLTGGYIGTGETLHLTQTVGGGAIASSTALTGTGMDVAFFDLTNVSSGDTFILSASNLTTGYRHASGLTFDTIAVPEPSSALLGLVGGLLLLRRRR